MNYLKYIGTPYIDKEMDCYGLVRRVYKNELGIELNKFGFLYASSGNTQESADAIKTVIDGGNGWHKVSDAIKPFDVLLFEIKGFVSHVGVYIGNNLFMHCMKGRETCLENVNSLTWTTRYRGAVRWKE